MQSTLNQVQQSLLKARLSIQNPSTVTLAIDHIEQTGRWPAVRYLAPHELLTISFATRTAIPKAFGKAPRGHNDWSELDPDQKALVLAHHEIFYRVSREAALYRLGEVQAAELAARPVRKC